jgi:hypothetical protein
MKKRHPRDEAFSIELPEDGADPSPVNEMVSTGSRLFFIRSSSVYELVLADQVDPDRLTPWLPHHTRKVLGVGSRSEAFSRTFLHLLEMSRNTIHKFSVENVSSGLEIAMDAAIEITSAEIEVISLQHDIIATMKACDEAVNVARATGRLSHFPQISGLTRRIGDILLNMKRYFGLACDVICCIEGHDERGLTLRKVIDQLKKNTNPPERFLKHVEDHEDHLRNLRELRNAFEHPEPSHTLNIENFRLSPEGEFIAPSWKPQLRSYTQQHDSDIYSDIAGLLEGLIGWFEEALAILFLDRNCFYLEPGIYEIPVANRDPQRPRRLTIQYPLEQLSVGQAAEPAPTKQSGGRDDTSER